MEGGPSFRQGNRNLPLSTHIGSGIREQFPQTWIFWVHASNAAKFEEGYRKTADKRQLPRRNEPTADILQRSDESNGRRIMILDNADDLAVFLDLRKGILNSDIDDLGGEAVSLFNFLPQTSNGSILVTSRSQDMALRFTGSHHDIIKLEPMDEDSAPPYSSERNFELDSIKTMRSDCYGLWTTCLLRSVKQPHTSAKGHLGLQWPDI